MVARRGENIKILELRFTPSKIPGRCQTISVKLNRPSLAASFQTDLNSKRDETLFLEKGTERLLEALFPRDGEIR